VGLRILFTGIVATLMRFPFLKLAGGAALLWIAVKLVVPGEGGSDDEVAGAETLWHAIKVVVVADIVMSLDNVIAIAAAVNGDNVLMIIGLALSVPLIVAGAALVMMLLEKLPILLWAGAGLLGWIAGEIMDEDPGLIDLFGEAALPNKLWTAAAGAALVLVVSFVLSRRNGRTAEDPVGTPS
jgi:YjbE family integral membrane protein